MIVSVLSVVACLLLAGALVTYACALAARNLFAMAMSFAVGASFAAAALLALGAGDASLLVVLVFAVACPIILLVVMSLSVRSAKPQPRRLGGWLTGLAACLLAAGVFSVLPDVGQPQYTPAPTPTLLLALVAFVAFVGCAALMGYGERGAFNQSLSRGANDQG
jgi:hypothetical protein